MKTEQPSFTTSVLASGSDLVALRFVGLTGAVTAAGAKALGVCAADTLVGKLSPVHVTGVLLATAGAAITAGTEIEATATGKAIAKTTGASNGFALDAATADGDVIRIVRGI